MTIKHGAKTMVDYSDVDPNPEEAQDKNVGNGQTLGNEVTVTFATLGNRAVKGKVDTGATTSSLHAENIKINQSNNSVSFTCPELSNSVVTMQLDGSQEVVSADAGGKTRPIVKFDVEIDGTPIKGASFNLNDRSEMDSSILIGQNILKVGNFIIDVNKDAAPERVEQIQKPSINRDEKVLEALQVLADSDVSLNEIIIYLRTAAVNSIKE